jgi:quinol monooxygenase YgiN
MPRVGSIHEHVGSSAEVIASSSLPRRVPSGQERRHVHRRSPSGEGLRRSRPTRRCCVARFSQQTRLLAKRGRACDLLEKFVEVAQTQQLNPACEVMLAGISASEPDTVYVFEVWSSEASWEHARASDEIAAWSKEMPQLVAEWPASTRLDSIGGKGI